MTKGDTVGTQDLILKGVDKALTVQQSAIDRHLKRLRQGRPDATPAEIIKSLDRQLLAVTTSSGAGVGAAAAAPGVGTTAAVALSAGESVAFLEAAALYTLSLASIHGVHVADLERRRTLFLAVMLGDSGARAVNKVAQRTGQHWARQVVQRIPMSQIHAINKVLGRNFVTKYGTKQGVVVLGRVVPFGIGAAIGASANAAMSTMVIRSARRAFGPPPQDWDEWHVSQGLPPSSQGGPFADPGSVPS